MQVDLGELDRALIDYRRTREAAILGQMYEPLLGLARNTLAKMLERRGCSRDDGEEITHDAVTRLMERIQRREMYTPKYWVTVVRTELVWQLYNPARKNWETRTIPLTDELTEWMEDQQDGQDETV
jgi:DNA-directed RNA polymerase specialized sigma24 family protein